MKKPTKQRHQAAALWLVAALTGTLLLIFCPPASAADKYAVIIGINTYKNANDYTPLKGCVGDARRMRQTALEQWGFPDDAEKTKLLTQEQASQKAILGAFEKVLIQNCKKEDTALFYFAGHGTQVEDDNGDESDNWDEALCPQDMSYTDASTWLIDDKMKELIDRLAAKCDNVVIIIDSCNSGTVTLAQALAAGERGIRGNKNPKQKLNLSPPPPKALDLDQDKYPKNHVLMSACLPPEMARELEGLQGIPTGITAGAFTTHLTQSVKATPLTPASFMQVSASVNKVVTEHGYKPQNPTLYGDPELLKKLAK